MRLGKLILSAGAALAFVSTDLGAQSVSFRRGDSNADARIDVSDPIFTLLSLFGGGAQPDCADAADANDDGRADISDAIFTLVHLFRSGAAPPAPGTCGEDPTVDPLACAAYAPCRIEDGPSEFATPLAGNPSAGFNGRNDAEDGGGPAPPASPSPQAPSGPPRLIEESDIYKLYGTNLFVLNRYRGLQVIDLADLDNPKLIGNAAIFGYPREMYVRGTRAYIIVSDYYSFWRDTVVETAPIRSFYGSQRRIVDIADPRHPAVIGEIDLAGDVSDSRIVGDVMYLVSHRYPWWFGTTDTEDKTQVLSIDISIPANVRVVDTKDFPRNGWTHHVHVTADAIYLASSGWEMGAGRDGYTTRIRYIDISDPAGSILIRGETTAPGQVPDRWALDEYEGVLRVASGQFWGNGDVFLTTYSVSNPDSIRRLGGYTLHVDERLTASRFDGGRAYLVSYRNIDPLFTFDLSDPARPKLLGELEMSGWLDFIVPISDERLVALGHEDLVNPDGSRKISLAVSLVDVAAQAAPKLVSRVTVGEGWGWVPGERDDFAKVFRVLPELGLIVFPFQAWSSTEYRYEGGVQLLDFTADSLTRRGLIRNAGWVERGIPHQEDTVLTLSSEVFQVLDIADRDVPRLRGRIELARNVQEFALLGGGHTVQLAGDWYAGDLSLIVTSIDDPNAPEPLSRIHLPAPYGRLFLNGSLVYVASVEDVRGENGAVINQATKVQVVDLADPAQPRLRGSVRLPELVWPGYRYWYWGWGDETVQVNGSTLAFHRFPYYYFWDCLACDVARPGGEVGSPEHRIYLVDLADPDAPVVASTVKLDTVNWAWGLKAVGSTLYLSSYQAFVKEDAWMARYFLERIEVSDPANPVELPGVNIPGMFIDAALGTPYIYTLETYWDHAAQKTASFLHALALDGDKAVLQSSVEIEGYAQGIQVKDGAAFTALSWYEQVPYPGGGFTYLSHSELVTIDLADAAAIKVAGRTAIPFDYAYLQEVEGGRAFLGSGAGIFTYRVSDITKPAFEAFHRTLGWVQDVVVRGDQAFLPSGYHGVQVIELGGGGP